MNVLPSIEDIKKIAATGEYKVVPVSTEILSDIGRLYLYSVKPRRNGSQERNKDGHCIISENRA